MNLEEFQKLINQKNSNLMLMGEHSEAILLMHQCNHPLYKHLEGRDNTSFDQESSETLMGLPMIV